MKAIKFNPDETGWVEIPGDTKIVVAHFKDGHKETFTTSGYLTAPPKLRKKVIQIDCYAEGEELRDTAIKR